MNRREMFTRIAGVVAGTSAVICIEPQIQHDDLVVVSFPSVLMIDDEQCEYLRRCVVAAIGQDGPRVLVLTDGATLRVERNIARVELPAGVTS